MQRFKQYIKETQQTIDDMPVEDIKKLYDFIEQNINSSGGISPEIKTPKVMPFKEAQKLLIKYDLGTGNWTTWTQIKNQLKERIKKLTTGELDLFGIKQ